MKIDGSNPGFNLATIDFVYKKDEDVYFGGATDNQLVLLGYVKTDPF